MLDVVELLLLGGIVVKLVEVTVVTQCIWVPDMPGNTTNKDHAKDIISFIVFNYPDCTSVRNAHL